MARPHSNKPALPPAPDESMEEPREREPLNVTVDVELLRAALDLGVDIERALDAGLCAAIRDARLMKTLFGE